MLAYEAKIVRIRVRPEEDRDWLFMMLGTTVVIKSDERNACTTFKGD